MESFAIFVFLFLMLAISIFKIGYIEKLLKRKIQDERRRVWIDRLISVVILLLLFGGLAIYLLVTVPVPD